MAKSVRHVSEQRRDFPGEGEAKSLINWLNTAPNVGAREFVTSLLDKMISLERYCCGFSEAKATRLCDEINKELKPYRMIPQVEVTQGVGLMRWGSYMVPSPVGPRISVETFAAVSRLIDLAKGGFLLKFGRCQCGSLFYQRFKHQTSCSEKCRLKHYKTTEEWKEKRRLWARENYRLHTTKNIK